MKQNKGCKQLYLGGMDNEVTKEDLRKVKISLSLLLANNVKRDKRLGELAQDTQGARDALDRHERDMVSAYDQEKITEFYAVLDKMTLAEHKIMNKFRELEASSPHAAKEYLQTHIGVRDLVNELLGKKQENEVKNS